MKDAGRFVQWFLIGCLCVLVILHAANFATAVTAVGGELRKDGALLATGTYQA